jgi:DNA polymerase III epsilon subunit-like protein
MYLVFDTETGGIGVDKSLLTAWFGVFDKDFNLRNELNLKVKPDDGVYQVTGQALEVNKINLVEHDRVAISYKAAGTLLYDFLRGNTKLGGEMLIPLGQNVIFDINFIVGKIISKGSWDCMVTHRLLDTMYIARFLQLNDKLPVESVSLGKLVEYFGVKVEGELHTAKTDALATFEVYKKLVEIIK